ncbi:bifunctional (p)ppGpp synthetase/guanosine-3',5'-bis(diphosphate) 3'-pyrophosphohydrolase [Patescibacteria group bacterium]|nr:bifunctional (p)ppGpp synthetase/guanosine-3',5'-bis(diphosphate) 3'-pyrophosphohydrolase [Patescibacteria group bacterium]
MIHTNRVRKALQFAARRHDGQLRREAERLPYITHPVSVALLLADADADEDTIIAGMLHDTIEDTQTTAEEIARAFGARASALVLAVSEPKTNEDGTTLTWKERKEAYLEQLARAEDSAVLISMADKIDNIESKIDAFEKEGSVLFERWAQKTEMYVWFHGAVLEEARKRNITGALRDRLEKVIKEEKEASNIVVAES